MIEFKNVSFSYESENKNVSCLKNLNLTIDEGECIVLCGDSGCGKTSLIRLINGLIPSYYDGELEGDVTLNGASIKDLQLYEIAQKVGSVFQNPKSQFFNAEVLSELSFVCENLGFEPSEIEHRVQQAIKDFSIEHLIEKRVSALSGGEKQKIACACVTTPNPDVFVFDEPSSNLDRVGIQLLVSALERLKEKKKTIVVAEHRLYYLKDIATKYIYMQKGEIIRIFTREEFLALSVNERQELGLRCSDLSELTMPEQKNTNVESIELENFTFSFDKKNTILDIPRLSIPKGRITAIIGNNGCGKTTFAHCLCGIYKNKGIVNIDNKNLDYKKRLSSVFLVMQDSNHQLFTETVLDEVLISLPNEDEKKAKEILNSMNLGDFLERHPMSLSGGQKQRTAIATALASNRDIIIFDEPTSGLDYKHMKAVSNRLKELANTGKTIIVITHDRELISDCCETIIEIEQGKIKN